MTILRNIIDTNSILHVAPSPDGSETHVKILTSPDSPDVTPYYEATLTGTVDEREMALLAFIQDSTGGTPPCQ